jgi:hypothetical protein
MTAADSVVSCRRRSPLFEPILGRFLRLHGDRRAVPRRVGWPDQDAYQVQVRVRVPPGKPLGRARQEQWLRAREKRCARRADKKNIAHGVCASGQPHPQRPPNDNGSHYFRCKRPQKRPKEQGRFVWR